VYAGRDPLTGRERHRSRTVRGSKRDAQRALTAMSHEADEGRLSASSSVTISELIESWLDLVETDLASTTIDGYRNLVRWYIEPGLGHVRVGRLTAPQLDTFYKALQRKKGLSSSTIRKVHAVLRRALKHAVKWGWISINPALNATPPRQRKHEIEPPSLDQVRLLVQAAETVNPPFAMFLRLAAASGLRRGEICGLRWSDLDAKKGVLLVRRSIVQTIQGLEVKDTKTHAARRMALDPTTLAALGAHRALMESRARECDTTLRPNAYLFSNAEDCAVPWRPDVMTNMFNKLCKRSGVRDVRLHDLRHLHATQLLGAGVPVRTVSGRLGHANAATTLNVYAHFVEVSDRQAAGIIGDLLDNEPSA
jgi:integrase